MYIYIEIEIEIQYEFQLLKPLFYANTFKNIKKISKHGIDPAQTLLKPIALKQAKIR